MQRLVFVSLSLVFASMALPPVAAAKTNYHCEITQGGKTTDDASIKTRKACKAKGGKWVKRHDHDNGKSGAGHEHGGEHGHDEQPEAEKESN